MIGTPVSTPPSTRLFDAEMSPLTPVVPLPHVAAPSPVATKFPLVSGVALLAPLRTLIRAQSYP